MIQAISINNNTECDIVKTIKTEIALYQSRVSLTDNGLLDLMVEIRKNLMVLRT